MGTKTKILLALIVAGVIFLALRYQDLLRYSKKARDYNLVVVSIDTCRADFIGAYGNTSISTPNLDSLAKRGALLEHYYTTINTTLPSHCSLFTGLYARNHGVARNAMRLHSRNVTLAEILKSNGYATGAFIGSFALASVFGMNQGFDTYEESFIGNPGQWIGRDVNITTSEGKTLEGFEPGMKTGDIARRAEDVNGAFFHWLDQNKSRKFFAFVHYYDPHFPYYPKEGWYKKHLDSIPVGTPLTEDERIAYYPKFRPEIGLVENFRPSSIGKIDLAPVPQALLWLYGSEIEYSDHAIGELLNRLQQAGLNDNTIVVVTSDHGENLVEHGRFNSFFRHGMLTHDSEIHVPFIISGPGVIPQGERLKNIYCQLDVMPMLLDLLGIENTAQFDGASFYRDLFHERKQSPRLIFSEASQPKITGNNVQDVQWPNNANSASLRTGEFKYMSVPWKKYEAVFHMTQDDLEELNIVQNLEASDPEMLSKLRSLMKAWRGTVMSGNIDQEFHLTEEDREKLESLGYVQ